jgi:hypothetical protein
LGRAAKITRTINVAERSQSDKRSNGAAQAFCKPSVPKTPCEH